MSFYRSRCIHTALASVADATTPTAGFPPRSTMDPYHLPRMYTEALQIANAHPWTGNSAVKPRCTLLILLEGFQDVLGDFETATTIAKSVRTIEELEPLWFEEEFSAIILFSPAHYTEPMQWKSAWYLLMKSQVDELTARLATSLNQVRPDMQAQEPTARDRNERWDSEAPEVNLQRTIESILSAVFQRIDSRTTFSSTSDVRHVDWRCPGKLLCQGVEVECSVEATLIDIIPNAPFGALKFSSPYELARMLSVLTQSHIPEAWRTARLLDRSYDLITPGGLGMALSFYQQHCIHSTLVSVAEAGSVLPEHPPRSGWDPCNMAVVTDAARRYASNHPWTNSSWKDLTSRKNLIILPAGFEKVVDCLKAENQIAVVMKKPEDLQPDWLNEDYSSILLFSPAEFAGTTRWRGAWTLLLQSVARGTELIAIAEPMNDKQWKKSVDMLQGFFTETIAQRSSLKDRLQFLLSLRSQQKA
ncbi:hypothetical protein COOONC_26127 [Cooperia oncophora]